MAWLLADDEQAPASTDVAAVLTDLLEGCFDFHVLKRERNKLLETSGYPGSSAVRIEFYLHLVPDKDLDAMQTHLAS